jgi:hypothetical protein
MYAYRKLLPGETIPGMVEGRGQRRMMEGVNLSRIYLIYCKNICNAVLNPPAKK